MMSRGVKSGGVGSILLYIVGSGGGGGRTFIYSGQWEGGGWQPIIWGENQQNWPMLPHYGKPCIEKGRMCAASLFTY